MSTITASSPVRDLVTTRLSPALAVSLVATAYSRRYCLRSSAVSARYCSPVMSVAVSVWYQREVCRHTPVSTPASRRTIASIADIAYLLRDGRRDCRQRDYPPPRNRLPTTRARAAQRTCAPAWYCALASVAIGTNKGAVTQVALSPCALWAGLGDYCRLANHSCLLTQYPPKDHCHQRYCNAYEVIVG